MTAKEQYLTALTRRSEFTPGAAIKSDDVEGRTKIYVSMVKGENTLEAGTPASFDDPSRIWRREPSGTLRGRLDVKRPDRPQAN